jgi:DNA polymerase I
MLIELQDGVSLQPGTFNAVIAREEVIISAINSNVDLQRYLFLFVSGNYSRILTGVNRTAANFEIRRAFTAHQLLTIIREASHTVVLIEHDPTLYDGAWDMLAPIAAGLKEISHEATVVLYSPAADPAFRALIREANRVYFLSPVESGWHEKTYRDTRSGRTCWSRKSAQKTLDA